MSKIYLKGFSYLGFLPTVVDGTSSYSASGTRVPIPSAVSCSKQDNKSTENIPADDNPAWDAETTWNSTTLTIVARQVALSVLKVLSGADVGTDGTIEEGEFDNSPEVALTYRGLRRDGGYRCYRYYRAKLTNMQLDMSTLGENSRADVTLTFECLPRSVDGKVRGTNDFAKTETDGMNTWLSQAISVSGASTQQMSLDNFTSISEVSELPDTGVYGVLYRLTDSDGTFDAGAYVYWSGSQYQEYEISDDE